MIRSAAFVFWMYGLMAVLGILFLPLLLISERATRWAIGLWVKLVRFGLRWIAGIETEITGREHLADQPLIYAAKHQSMFDIVAPFLILDAPTIILKRELLYYPMFGWYAWRAGMIPIDRGGTLKTLKAMVKVAQKGVSQGRSVVIFPEGTRKIPGAAPDYKIGVFALYKEAGIACTPVATNSGCCWPAKGLRRYPGKVTFQILPAIAPGLSRAEFMSTLEAQIETASNRLLTETSRPSSPQSAHEQSSSDL